MSNWRRPDRSKTNYISMTDIDQTVALVENEQRAQEMRSTAFAELKVRNPLWDMLLALLAARRTNRQLSMSDLCSMCDAPESTALRLIHQLRDKGYADMVADRSDRRRTRVVLTAKGAAQFDTYFQQTANG